jgi:hypothetical protein
VWDEFHSAGTGQTRGGLKLFSDATLLGRWVVLRF